MGVPPPATEYVCRRRRTAACGSRTSAAADAARPIPYTCVFNYMAACYLRRQMAARSFVITVVTHFKCNMACRFIFKGFSYYVV